MIKNFSAPRSLEGVRLLSFLKERLPHTTKELRWLVEHHRCTINGTVERFCSTKLYGGEKVRIKIAGKKLPSFEPQRILFQDDAILIYNKPAGVSSEEIAKGGDLLLVHRLDRDTTGVFLLAKTEEVQTTIEAAFRERLIDKHYLAVVRGRPQELEGEITSSLEVGSRREGALKMRVANRGGKKSRTSWKVLKRKGAYTLIQCKPYTGRTHQIRVHLASINLPLLGDLDYGTRENQEGVLRPLLHAQFLTFPHPVSGEMIEWQAPIPKDIKQYME
jgi:23S rRNA pseudouridine955/2504/2580 synthase